VFGIFRKYRGVNLGAKAGEQWRETRYDVPYLRDFMMDYGLIMDSLETATVWSNVWHLYEIVAARIRVILREVTGFDGYLGCHISHLYNTGACIYYTMAVRAKVGSTPQQVCDQYHAIKAAATEAIVRAGGALSHHHAVGYEHQPWMTLEHSPAALTALRAAKAALDPQGLMNPGSLFPPASPAG
jgi:alkyldihydroxyacetonephosphate synthase